MDKLHFIFSTREMLQNKGYRIVKRCLTRPRKFKVDEYKHLAHAYPHLYHPVVGSTKWIEGLLMYLNEPTVLAWDDVLDWCNHPESLTFFTAPPSEQFPVCIRKVPVKLKNGKISKTPGLKQVSVNLQRCNMAQHLKQSSGKVRRRRPLKMPLQELPLSAIKVEIKTEHKKVPGSNGHARHCRVCSESENKMMKLKLAIDAANEKIFELCKEERALLKAKKRKTSELYYSMPTLVREHD